MVFGLPAINERLPASADRPSRGINATNRWIRIVDFPSGGKRRKIAASVAVSFTFE